MAMKVVQGMRKGEEVKQGAGHQGMRRVSGSERVSNTITLFILVLIKLAAF